MKDLTYAEWLKQRVVIDRLGGEPVFAESKLSVMSFGKRVVSGVPNLGQKYPYLSDLDVQNAVRFFESGDDFRLKAEFSQEVHTVASLVLLPAGPRVDLFGVMEIYRLEDGRYAVSEEDKPETFFDGPQAAAEHFVVRRRARHLGLDY